MQGSLEEKEKCLEKLGQMEKYISFLDFMIDKIKKKSGEISLECQLSKLENMRCMIAEKNGRYTLDTINRVEVIIKKLIAKLDYKDQCNSLLKEPIKFLGSPKFNEELLKVSNSVTSEPCMSASLSVIPSTTTTTISITNAASLFEVTTVDSRPRDSHTNTVDLIMKTLKTSPGNKCHSKNNTDNVNDEIQLIDSLEQSCVGKPTKAEVFSQNLILNLNKDLDGFEVTECQNLSQVNKRNTTPEGNAEKAEKVEKVSSQMDLLSSSREKLLKSLQKKLNLPNTVHIPGPSTGDTKFVKLSDSQSISASSLLNKSELLTEEKSKSELSVSGLNSEEIVNCAPDKYGKKGNLKSKITSNFHTPTQSFSSESFSSDNKFYYELECSATDINSKQKLREKLSADICEVYRVPGKSVGGSLRSLKEAKDLKKSMMLEEEELFKPDKITGINKSIKYPIDNKEKEQKKYVSHTNYSNSKINEVFDKTDTKKNLSEDKVIQQVEDSQKNKREEKHFTKEESKNEVIQFKKHSNGIVKAKSDKKLIKNLMEEKKNKTEEINSFSEKEQLEFVKENMHSFQNLSKLKPTELKKAQSSFSNTFSPERNCFSSLNEDVFKDLDEFMNDDQYFYNNKEKVKAPTNSTSSSKINNLENKVNSFTNVVSKQTHDFLFYSKPNIEFNSDEKEVDKIESKIQDIDNFFNDVLDDTAFAQKLIEETTEAYCKRKKELSVFRSENVLDDNSFKKCGTSKLLCVSDRDPRKKKTQTSTCVGSNKSFSCNLDSKSDFENRKNEDGPLLDKYQNSTLQLMTANQQEFSNEKLDLNLARDLHLTKRQQINQKVLENKPYDSLTDTSVFNTSQIFLTQENQCLSNPYVAEIKNVQNYQSDVSKLPVQGAFSRYSKKEIKPADKHFSEAKSYAEYKLMKLKQQKVLEKNQKEKNILPGNLSDVSSTKKHKNVKKDVIHNYETEKTSSKTDIVINYSNLKCENLKHQKSIREELKKKTVKHKKQSMDSDDLISPLEELYQSENKSLLGRGYGLQNFKIPKKRQKNNCSDKRKQVPQKNSHCKKEQIVGHKQLNISSDIAKNNQIETNINSKADFEIFEKSQDKQEINLILPEMCNTSKSIENTFSDSKNFIENVDVKNNCHIVSSLEETIKDVSFISKENNIQTEESLPLVNDFKNTYEEKGVKKCEVAECDSSVESTNLINSNETKISNADKAKCTSISKDEITQEFVEALIRKSFQSGEGKLLLAQAKLFEEFTQKLNSKKLKTIQKIINSESDSDSSSSDSFSENDKKNKCKTKKLERKNIRRKKKKTKKFKKQIKNHESNVDDNSEEEKGKEKESIKNEDDNSEEEKGKEKESIKNEDYLNQKLNIEKEEISSFQRCNDNGKNNICKSTKACHLPEQKVVNKQRIRKKQAIDFGRSISKKKKQRKQDQKKLLEEILNEAPSSNNLEKTESIITKPESIEKEIEQKPKTKPKAKAKTELDRLHDDIRSMFICKGIVTATGQRMCRILKESGGNMKNLDIVKESAKMVEEEKLKKVGVRENPPKLRDRNTTTSRGRSRSRSSDKFIKSRDLSKSKFRTNSSENANTGKSINLETSGPIVCAENLKKQSYVVMHKLNLNNFAYGKNISEGCLTFNLKPKRNVAYRGRNRRGAISRSSCFFSDPSLAKNVYLARNKRKCLRLKNKIVKKDYKRKSLLEVIKNLPLKMAKMKHLEIVSCKRDKRKKRGPKKENLQIAKSNLQNGVNQNHSFNIESQKTQLFQNLSSLNLLDYAFDKKKSVYSCKLCYHQTSNITRHYKTDHAESEVLISRLSREEAQKAMVDTTENSYNKSFKKERSSEINEKEKLDLYEDIFYKCRMCSQNKTSDFNSFFFHVSGHTGEYRYKCPSKGCSFSADTREYMKIHILSRHPINWRSIYHKIIELFPIPPKSRTLFGYLCSECNFVQIFESNLKHHIQKSHPNDDNIRIIKIDMSDKILNSNKKKEDSRIKSGKNNLNKTNEKLCESENKEKSENFIDVETIELGCDKNLENHVGESENLIDIESVEWGCDRGKENHFNKISAVEQPVSLNLKKHDSFVPSPESKESEVGKKKTCKETIIDKASKNSNYVFEDEFLMETQNQSEKMKNVLGSNVEDESVNSKNICFIKNAEIIDSVEINDKQFLSPKTELVTNLKTNQQTKKEPLKLKIGPLEVQIFGDSDTLYECHVKKCLFSTKIFDLFEKHIRISHSKIKWTKPCEICLAKDTSKLFFTSKLSSALHHLKFHENIVLKNNSIQEKSNEDEDVVFSNLFGDEDDDLLDVSLLKNSYGSLSLAKDDGNIEFEKFEIEDASYPPKPRLRVRNFFGDRLSTPKENFIENEDTVFIREKSPFIENCAVEENSKNNSPKMFTIENVRSLQMEENPQISDVDMGIQPKKNNELKKNTSEIGKPVVVRSCPSRQIAIQPDSSSVPVESNLKLVKTSSVNPVVLGALSNAPIRILSSTPSPNYKFSIQSVMVSASNSFLTNTNTVSVIRPVPPLTVSCKTTSSISSVQAENKDNSLLSTEGKNDMEKQLPNTSNNNISKVSSDKNKSLIKRVRSKVYRSNSNSNGTDLSPSSKPISCLPSSEACLSEKKDEIKEETHKFTRTFTGNKSVKDAKIYQEMLMKTKLCHLFKCMAVECSFTCNDENIFTQHLGLHEAQRRMKSQKTWKTISFYSNSKIKKAFNWQQCAYCCEVLANSGFALSRHVIVEHGHCIYQCAYCFYRAVSQSYVEIHQNLAHPRFLKNNLRTIYKCKSFSRAPSPASALEKQGRRQSVRPYHCDQCGKKFFITQEFMNHLTTEHQSVTAYTCHICKNLCFKAERLVAHYKLHSYCTYQCAFCLHGTETEKEMVFHLCNFHFSQPAYMYVRALAHNKKCSSGSQLDSLKVIHYESDTLNPECIEEADSDDQIPNEFSKEKESQDLSVIVAKLGITPENEETIPVTPLIKELACLGNRNCENISVKSLLPNAQFSSENDNSGENCSVLISSGLSFNGIEENEEKEISIPLGQLNVETVTVQSTPPKSTSPASAPKNVLPNDKSMKLNEILINIHQKEKSLLPFNVEESSSDYKKKSSTASTAIHKMPPVVLTRITDPKNVYPSKSGHIVKKVYEESLQGNENIKKKEENILKSSNLENKSSCISQDKEKIFSNLNCGNTSLHEGGKVDKEIIESQPIITNVRSLCIKNFEKNDSDLSSFAIDNFPKIAEVCSLTTISAENRNSKISAETAPTVENVSVEKLPNVAKENFSKAKINESKKCNLISQAKVDNIEKENIGNSVESPEVIILDNEKNVLTVTIDSEDEKETESFQGNNKVIKETKISILKKITRPNETIRKEMELLRNQIANETECLLIDDTDNENSSPDLPLILKPKEDKGEPKSSLCTVEKETLGSLNEILEKEDEMLKEKKLNEQSKSESETCNLPRTRSSAKERTRKEEILKHDSDESNLTNTSELNDVNKKNKFKTEIADEYLYICGNEKCFFAGKNESELKDHLYVCDSSRDSLMLLCPHCSKQLKQIGAYIEHLKHHGEKKYSCGLCSFKSAVENSVTRHIKQKHRCGLLKSVPGDPPKTDHLIFYPKNYKLDKVDFEANGYSPGDEDKLPLQAVYQINVKCAKCPYFTKVRSNMVRHLKIHVKSAETEGVVVVPSTAPTNPVPCLDTKERMFDKMTNLAASSQLAQAKEKISIEALPPEEEAKLPHFIPEQMRYKCCLPDCNYITVDDGMLKHHIKALHDEINYYSCPHCKNTVHVDVRHVTLDKIGHHLKYHDSKLFKCAHCIYFHYQKTVVEKHTLEKHPDKRYYVHVVRDTKGETSTSEESHPVEPTSKVWKCGLCDDFYSLSKVCILEHLMKLHNTRSKYKCQLCDMKSNHCHAFLSHFASKHAGEKVSYLQTFKQVVSSSSESHSTVIDASSEHFDTTPLWQRGAPRVRHIRGILIEEAEVKTKKSKKSVEETKETDVEVTEVEAPDNSYFCPLCSDKKPFYTRNADVFRSHLYQELNYQQFACTLCGKMFVDKKDYEKHHSKFHQDKPQSLKQTKEDGEITFWVDKMIAKQREKIESKKRRLSEQDSNEENRGLTKKKRKID